MTPKMLALAVAFALVGVASFAHAAAPPGRYTTTTEVVTDTSTGLQWQRNADFNNYTQAGALAYCEGLTLGGETDWRAPTLQELLSIVDPTESDPPMDPSAFPEAPSRPFWTMSPFVGSAGGGWVVFFDFGRSAPNPVDSPGRVRCVR